VDNVIPAVQDRDREKAINAGRSVVAPASSLMGGGVTLYTFIHRGSAICSCPNEIQSCCPSHCGVLRVFALRWIAFAPMAGQS
jgi:hypothetical protein